MDERRPLCAEVSRESAEPLAATASRIENWILLEYRGLWSRDIVAGSGLSDQVKAYLREQLAVLPRSRLLFIRRPERRQHPEYAFYVARTAERGSIMLGAELGGYSDLLDLDLAGALDTGSAGWAHPVEGPFLVVCTHGKRDRCCAKFGRPLYDAVREQAEEDTVWQASHVGGDRFAGNLVSLPRGPLFRPSGALRGLGASRRGARRPHPPRALPGAFLLLVRRAGGRAGGEGGDRCDRA